MHTSARILIVEDDENLRVGLRDNLVDEGYSVRAAGSVAEAERLLGAADFDLCILDLMLPDGDGYALCERLRSAGRDTLVLMLTARSLEDDLVRGFAAGADDYLAKPYRLRELLSRVGALLRRRSPRGPGELRFAGFTLDLGGHALRDPNGAPIALTRTEFDLLVLLVRNPGRALRRGEILDEVWGLEVVVDPRTVDNFISSLKKKLGWSRRSPYRIATVRGVGYRFEIEESPTPG